VPHGSTYTIQTVSRAEHAFVWLGGGLFVASLAFCAYRFAVTWSDAASTNPRRAVASDVALFALFAAHHSLFARDGVKAVLARAVPPELMRSTYVWVASLLFMLLLAAWQPVGGVLYDVDGWAAAAAGLLQLAGIVLIASAVRAIDPLELAGIRPAAWGASPLQVRGPYGFIRHPLYLGWMLVVLGAGRMTGDRALFAWITSIYLVAAVPWEERSLERVFGDAYARYRARVRWRIVPYLY
jgi:protein-S-isoprenylcysteine O-methyltransferase Ste14